MVESIRKEVFFAKRPLYRSGLHFVVLEEKEYDCLIPTINIENVLSAIGKHEGRGLDVCVGDVLWIDDDRGVVRSILSSRANSNTLLLTERCDNLCIFCSQPPNFNQDYHLYERAFLALQAYKGMDYVGLSGGEPTINRKGFLFLLESLNTFNVETPLHILTNGRSFKERTFCDEVFSLLENREVLWGIPIYGHQAILHDEVVQARGAFLDTLEGIQRMLSKGAKIEIRIVPCSNNFFHVHDIVQFLCSSFEGLQWISIMNMEPKGYARNNYESLYVKVVDQVPYISRAMEIVSRHGIGFNLFNYPYCLLSDELREFSVKSISDWKNYYPDDCGGCDKKDICGGFFSSATGKFIEKVEPIYEN